MISTAFTVTVGLADSKTNEHAYSYSTPEAAFNSFQKAIQEKDLKTALVGLSHLVTGPKAKTADADAALPLLVEEYRNRKNFSLEALDSGAVEGGFKITEAKFVREVSRKHVVEDNGSFTLCRILVKWPPSGEQTHLEIYNFDGADRWWFWPTFQGRLKTFKEEPKGKN